MYAVQCDVTSRASVLALASKVRETEGKVDLLVCNAGVSPTVKPFTDHDGDIRALQSVLWENGSPADFGRTFDVNVGLYLLSVQ